MKSEIYFILISSRYQCSTIFCFQYHYTPCKNLPYRGNLAMVSIWFRMVLTRIINRVYIDSLAFTYPTNINVWLVSKFDTHEHILWYHTWCWLWHHAFPCTPYQHWWTPLIQSNAPLITRWKSWHSNKFWMLWANNLHALRYTNSVLRRKSLASSFDHPC